MIKFLMQFFQLQQRSYFRKQFEYIKRLADKIICSAFYPGYFVFFIIEGGQENDREKILVRLLLQFLAEFEPVYPRHHHIQNCNVNRIVVADIKGRIST